MEQPGHGKMYPPASGSIGSGKGSRAVQSITFFLLDSKNHVIRKQTITDYPTEARLTRTAKTTAYLVNVQYINGTTANFVSSLWAIRSL